VGQREAIKPHDVAKIFIKILKNSIQIEKLRYEEEKGKEWTQGKGLKMREVNYRHPN
jgi:hypothetical protein